MGARSPGPGQKPPSAGSLTGDDELTAAAEIVIMLFPPGAQGADGTAGAQDAGNTGKLPARLVNLMRRIGLQARLAAPASDAGEMLAVVRHVTIVLSWTVLMIGTLAIMVPAGMAARTIITVIALELAGFVIGTLALHKRRKDS